MRFAFLKFVNYQESTRNFVAILFGMGSQIIIQLISIPLFLHFFTVRDYAIWVISLNIAQFANFIDLGTITANQNAFPLLQKKGKVLEISQRISQNLNLLTINLAILIILCVVEQIAYNNIVNILLVISFGISVYVQNLFGLIEATKRMNGKNSLGLNLASSARMIEFASYTIVIILGVSNLLTVSIVGTTSKFLLFCIIESCDKQLTSKGIFRSIDYVLIKEMTKSGFPYALIKISDILALSGVVLILQKRLSPLELLLFVSFRTFLRFGLQLSNLINFTFYFELSKNWTENSYSAFKRNIKLNSWSTFMIASILILGYSMLGQALFSYWTHGQFHMTSSINYCGIFYLVILIFSQAQKIKFHAINANLRVSSISFLTTIVSLAIIGVSKEFRDISEVFILLGIAEIVSIILVQLQSTNALQKVFFHHSNGLE
jgi:O-antigen/teichoic acid export membrane protein